MKVKSNNLKVLVFIAIIFLLSISIFILSEIKSLTNQNISSDLLVDISPTPAVLRYSSSDTLGSSKIGAYFGQDEFSFAVSEEKFNSKINHKTFDEFRLEELRSYPPLALEKNKFPKADDIIQYLKNNIQTDIVDNYTITKYSTRPSKIFSSNQKANMSEVWYQASASFKGIPIIMTHTNPDIAQWANIMLKDNKWDFVFHLSLANKITETIKVDLRNYHKTKYHIENKNVLMMWSEDQNQMPQNQFNPNTENSGKIVIDDIQLVYTPQTKTLIPMYLICGTQTPNSIDTNKKNAYVCGIMEAVDYQDDGLTDVYKY